MLFSANQHRNQRTVSVELGPAVHLPGGSRPLRRKSRQRTVLRFIVRLSGSFMIGVTVPLALETMVPQPHPWQLLAFYYAFVLSGGLSLYLAFSDRALAWVVAVETREDRLEPFHMALPPFLFMGFFIATCRMMASVIPGSFVVRHSSMVDAAWIFFWADHSIRAVMLDLLEAYQLPTSPVNYSAAFVPCTTVFLYRAGLTVFFWRLIAGLHSRYRSRRNTE